MPMYWAARAYIAAISGFNGGIPLDCPINPVVPPSPIIRYAVGRASIPCIFTALAPNACAPVMKYGLSELSSEVNYIASASGVTPVMFPGKSIVGIFILFLTCSTKRLSCV